MEAPVVNRHLDVDDRKPGQIALVERVAHAFFDRWNILARDNSPDDFICKFEAAAALQRFNLKPAIAVLSTAAGLPLVLTLRLGAPFDSLLVRHLGRGQLDIHVELALELFDGHLDMHLACARENDLMSLWIAMSLQGGVFLDQACERL